MQTLTLKDATVNNPTCSLAKSWVLSKRQLCDLECLLTHVYFPLEGFLDRENYDSVCQTMRLKNGALCPMPVTLDVTSSFASECEFGEEILLVNEENQPLASMIINAIWKPNKKQEAQLVFGTIDKHHPGVAYLYEKAGDWYLGGEITTLKPMIHYNFLNYRHTPAELKQLFKVYGWSKIIAFQTRNPIHRAQYALIRQATETEDARLLIHPVIGMTMSGDVDPVIRVKCYEKILQRFAPHYALLSIVPMAMRMAGPREALWHALIQKNYGVTHFIIGRDHASPGLDGQNHAFYSIDAAQTLVQEHAKEIGIDILAFPTVVYVKEKSKYVSINDIGPEDTPLDILESELHRKLESCENIPDWYSFPEVLTILKKAYPPKLTQGYTIFFTGQLCSGKSTVVNALLDKLLETNARTVTLLDSDTPILPLGFMAAEITKHQGIVLCAAIAPLASVRQVIRENVRQYGGFIEVYVSSPLLRGEDQDVKGSYGVNNPFEPPISPEVTIDIISVSVNHAVDKILNKIESLGYSWRHSLQELHVI